MTELDLEIKTALVKRDELLDRAIKKAYKGRARIIECERKNENLDEDSLKNLIDGYREMDDCLKEALDHKIEISELIEQINNTGVSNSKCIDKYDKISDVDECIENIERIKNNTRKIVDRGAVYQVKKQYKKIKSKVSSEKKQNNNIEKGYNACCNKLNECLLIRDKYVNMVSPIYNNVSESNKIIVELNDIKKISFEKLKAKSDIYRALLFDSNLNDLAKEMVLDDFQSEITRLDMKIQDFSRNEYDLQCMVDRVKHDRKEVNKKVDSSEAIEVVKKYNLALEKYTPENQKKVDVQITPSKFSQTRGKTIAQAGVPSRTGSCKF